MLASSIGIIGGADGPTAIFITANPSLIVGIGALCVVALAGLIWFLIRKFTKK